MAYAYSLFILLLRTIVVLAVVFYALSWWTRRPKNLPPGPMSWPILGSLPNLGISMYRSGLQPQQYLAKLSKHYGKVYSLYLGSKLVIIVNSVEGVKEAFQNQHLTDRPTMIVPEKITSKGHGVLMSSGAPWRDQRRFTLSTFRGFGVGKRSFQDQISVEVQALCEEFASFNGESMDPRKLLSNAVSNIICSLVFGKRFEYSDTSFQNLLHILDKSVERSGSGVADLFIPIFRFLKLRSLSDEEIYQEVLLLWQFFDSIIQDHRDRFDPSDLKDYIDVYLDEIKKVEGTDRALSINKLNLRSTVPDLFAAGSESTVTTLRWAILYMMGFPEVQAKVQQEIDNAVGRDRLPNMSDREQMPYAEATLMEVQRIATISPFGVPHSASEDTSLFGYTIPQNAFVVSNIWAIHHDTQTWKDPDVFRPERFMDENRLKKQPEEYLPFSTGRRVCPGENLAKMELFLFFTHLLHRFTFKKPTGVTTVCFDGKIGAAYAPKNFKTEAFVRD